MRKMTVIVSLIIVSLLFSSAVFAAPWNVPTNVKIVQENGSIQAAINNSPATPDTPYMIKVMPGIYHEKVTLKPYVYLVGSGRDNTIISWNVNNNDDHTCTNGTVIMDNNSSISNIRIMNNAADANPKIAAGLIFNNVAAKAEAIDVFVGTATAFNARNAGICTVGISGRADLNNIYVEVNNAADGHSNPIMVLADSSLTLTNSRIVAYATGDTGDIHGIDCDEGGTGLGTVTITNSSIEGTAAGTGVVNAVHFNNGCKAFISHSILKGVNGGWINTIEAQYDLSIANTQIYRIPGPNTGGGAGIYWTGVGTAKIANSLIQGGIEDPNNMKLFNNYDENLVAIPNQ